MKRHFALLGMIFLLCSALTTGPYATAAIVPSLLVKLSNLPGHEVQNPQGDQLGKIEDVVLDAATGHIAYAVLSFGGFLGLGETWVIMPWRLLQTTNDGQTITLDMSEEQLKNAPRFDRDQWPDLEDQHWGDTIHDYYGQEPYWGQQLPPTAAHETSEPPQFKMLRSREALQQDVMNTRGQHIGKIEDIVIDTTLGDIAYAVLSFGGVLGLGEKWFAVPWGAFEPSAGFHTFTLDVQKETLKNMQGFDKDDWPEMANRQWASVVHDAFRQTPYWERHSQAQSTPERANKTQESGDAKQESNNPTQENSGQTQKSRSQQQQTDDKGQAEQTRQQIKGNRQQTLSHAPVTVTNAVGTVLALIGPVTVSCQPQQATAGDVTAIAQSNNKHSETQRELTIQQQDGKVRIGCSRPTSHQQDTSETSKPQ